MEQTQQTSLKAKVQKLGSTLSSMVMPNIGALIAWGVLTALFIPDGYLPNESFASMVGPMLTYLIPLLVGYTGGKVIAGERGAVVGAIATMGVIVGTEIPMIMGAMIMGPLGGFTIKKFDAMFQNKIKTGFEMLVNNFSAGLIGFALALLGFQAIGPVVDRLTQAMAAGVETILNAQLIPLTNIFIEPAKILFLNNAINHGILTPLGTEQVSETGRSILFLLEANPGPGLGVLLAFTLFGKGSAKSTAPGAMIIHFLGGIHEIYFPLRHDETAVIPGSHLGRRFRQLCVPTFRRWFAGSGFTWFDHCDFGYDTDGFLLASHFRGCRRCGSIFCSSNGHFEGRLQRSSR